MLAPFLHLFPQKLANRCKSKLVWLVSHFAVLDFRIVPPRFATGCGARYLSSRVGIMSTPDAATCCGETNRLSPRRGGTGNILGQFLVPLVLPSRSPSGIARFSTREMYRAEIDPIPEALYTSRGRALGQGAASSANLKTHFCAEK
jgi:hypothetical protein